MINGVQPSLKTNQRRHVFYFCSAPEGRLFWLVNLPPLVSLNKALLSPYFWGGTLRGDRLGGGVG